MGEGDWEVTQSKPFPCRHENQNLDTQNACRSQAGSMAGVGGWGWGQQESELPGANWLARLRPRVSKRPCLNK